MREGGPRPQEEQPLEEKGDIKDFNYETEIKKIEEEKSLREGKVDQAKEEIAKSFGYRSSGEFDERAAELSKELNDYNREQSNKGKEPKTKEQFFTKPQRQMIELYNLMIDKDYKIENDYRSKKDEVEEKRQRFFGDKIGEI